MYQIEGEHLYRHGLGLSLFHLLLFFAQCASTLWGRTILYKAKVQNIRSNISVTMCTWGGHFSLGKRDKQSFHSGILLRVMTSALMSRCMCRLSQPKHYDIIRMLYGDVTMMLWIWNDGIYISLEEDKMMNTRWGQDSKLDFRSIPLSYLGASKHQACQELILNSEIMC